MYHAIPSLEAVVVLLLGTLILLRRMKVNFVDRLVTLLIVVSQLANAWTPLARPCSSSRAFMSHSKCLHLEKKEDANNANANTIKDADASETKSVNAEWGVSYIGGDPCGSKYNDDPFDSKPSKPGFPDDMKARIEALAEQKKRESELN
jgi:hypothetical protein